MMSSLYQFAMSPQISEGPNEGMLALHLLRFGLRLGWLQQSMAGGKPLLSSRLGLTCLAAG